MANEIKLTFAGDASQLSRASQQASAAVQSTADAAGAASRDVETRMGRLGAAATGLSTAVGDAGATITALSELQQAAANKAMRQARALADVEQAGIDASQALVDLRQAQLDLTQAGINVEQAHADAAQAVLDQRQAAITATVAQRDYVAAVREFGPGSAEAMQAQLDLAQAQEDMRQAGIDAKQATADVTQAQIDAAQAGTDMAQATRDAGDAQLNLTDAQRELKAQTDPSLVQDWGQKLELITPILTGLMGATSLMAMAQVGLNFAFLTSPITWIVLAVVALVAIIAVIATKTTWFQDLWKAAWGGIKKAAAAVWDWLKGVPAMLGKAFKVVADVVTAPFRLAFNAISKLWNNTIGKLSWTVPTWIPGIGGANISAPKLPEFHQGGVVPGAPGSEMLAVLQAGETVTPARGAGVPGAATRFVLEIRSGGTRLDDLLVEILARAVRLRGGDVQLVLGGGRG